MAKKDTTRSSSQQQREQEILRQVAERNAIAVKQMELAAINDAEWYGPSHYTYTFGTRPAGWGS